MSWKNSLVIYAMNWLTRTHLGRTDAEKAAYLEAVSDTLTAMKYKTDVLARLEGLFHFRNEEED